MSHLKKGFTLVEALSVIGVLAVLTAMAVPSYASMRKNVVFGNTFQEIASALRMAQNNSMTAQDGNMWGVKFNNDSYIMLECNDENCSSPSNTDTYPVSGLKIITPATNPIIFNRLSGTLYGAAVSQTIAVENEAGSSVKNIFVEPNGKISP
ncbi:MAG: prepilin-type N-terminal cleavage/methylation domain-containing protein [Patescibacteria group bacterium]